MGIYNGTKPLSTYYAEVDDLPNGEIATREVSGTDTSKDWFGAVDSSKHFYDSYTETDPPTMNNYLADEDETTSTSAYMRDTDGDHAPDRGHRAGGWVRSEDPSPLAQMRVEPLVDQSGLHADGLRVGVDHPAKILGEVDH